MIQEKMLDVYSHSLMMKGLDLLQLKASGERPNSLEWNLIKKIFKT